ncbi:hypothetical protein IAT40_002640 [Kwoniella sp. CBS 6097]
MVERMDFYLFFRLQTWAVYHDTNRARVDWRSWQRWSLEIQSVVTHKTGGQYGDMKRERSRYVQANAPPMHFANDAPEQEFWGLGEAAILIDYLTFRIDQDPGPHHTLLQLEMGVQLALLSGLSSDSFLQPAHHLPSQLLQALPEDAITILQPSPGTYEAIIDFH